MAQVKGTLLNAWKHFLKDRYGEEKLNSAIETLAASDRLHLQSPILDSTWYPMEFERTLRRLTKSLASPSEKDLPAEMGRYIADYFYAHAYRMLLRTKPSKDKPLEWFEDLVYQNLRDYAVEMTGPSSSVVRYYYLESKPTAGQCQTLRAFIARKLELSGYQAVTCSHGRCAGKGDECCEFFMQWDGIA